MKKLVAAFLAASITLTTASTALAAGPAEVKQGVNFRNAPSTDSKVIRMLKRGEDIQVLDKHNNYWLKIKTKDGKTGYISANAKYTDYQEPASTSDKIITTGYPYFRSQPSVTNSTIYRSIPKGTELTVLAKPNNHYVKVKFDGKVGYISTKYIQYTQKKNNNASNNASKNQNQTSKADAIIATADSLVNRATYVYGVRNPEKLIFDCSSFTQYVFGKHGVDLKWGTRFQKNAGTFVSKSNLKKGDLVFFSLDRNSNEIGHVGIYVGNNKFIHILKDKKSDVQYDNLNKGYWKDRYVTARRVL